MTSIRNLDQHARNDLKILRRKPAEPTDREIEQRLDDANLTVGVAVWTRGNTVRTIGVITARGRGSKPGGSDYFVTVERVVRGKPKGTRLNWRNALANLVPEPKGSE